MLFNVVEMHGETGLDIEVDDARAGWWSSRIAPTK
jgi:hypothetical protein